MLGLLNLYKNRLFDSGNEIEDAVALLFTRNIPVICLEEIAGYGFKAKLTDIE